LDSGGLVLCRGGLVQNAAVVLRQAEVAEAVDEIVEIASVL
jgi:hypothetical protein